MDQAKQPSPYFIRRTVGVEQETLEPRALSLVEEPANPLWEYWTMVNRHRWLIGTCALAIFLCFALYAFTRIPLYTADATLMIERKAPQFLKVQDTRTELGDSENEFLKTQYEILKSPAFAERVIRDEGLEGDPLFTGAKDNERARKPGFVAGAWEDIKEWAQGLYKSDSKTNADSKINPPAEPGAINQGLVGAYLSGLEVRPITGTSLVQIKFTTPVPALSARLANAHVSSYVRYGIDLRSRTNDEATVFLQQKLVELKERVEQSEAALNNYRKDKGIISVDDKANIVVDRLLDLNKNLTSAEADRIALEAQMRSIKGRNYDELSIVRSSASINALKNELSKSEVDYAALAKEFKPGYPPLDTLKARMEDTRGRLQNEIQKEVKAIEANYATAKSRETQLRTVMEEQKKSTLDLKDSAVQYGILAREVDTNRQLYDGVLQRLKEIGVAADVRTSNVYVMGKAKPPLVPSFPNKRRLLLLGLLLGLAVGLGFAFLIEQLDNTFKSPEEAERYIRLPTLAVVPDFALLNGRSSGYLSRLVHSAKSELAFNGSNGSTENQLILNHHPLSLVTEAYRSLRSSLLLSQAGGPPQTILITSSGRGDGKTTTLVNSAMLFAQMGVQVLIIDADLRRPNCHTLLKIENGVGLAEVLAGQVEWRDVIKPTLTENLFLINSGAEPPNPAELLGSKNMRELLQELREHYEFIFVDSSPVMAVTDAVLVSTIVDGTLLVVGRNTPKPLLRKALMRLSTPHAKILGTLLNRVDIRTGEYTSYYHQYYEYYREDPATIPNASAMAGKKNGKMSRELAATRAVTSEPAARKEPADGSPSAILELAVAKLSESIGPMAPLILREYISALGESSDSFPQARLAELVQQVSSEISTDSLRLRFEEEMLQEINLVDIRTVENGSNHNQDGEEPTTVPNAAPISVEKNGGLAASRKARPEFLGLMVAKLTRAMGPMAPLVLCDHIVALGESSDSFPQARLAELIKRVSSEIATDSLRLRFEEEMLKEIRNA